MPDYIQIRVRFMKGSRIRPQEFNQRVDYFIEMNAKNKKFGFAGIEEHYYCHSERRASPQLSVGMNLSWMPEFP